MSQLSDNRYFNSPYAERSWGRRSPPNLPAWLCKMSYYFGITTAAKAAQYFINVSRAIACIFRRDESARYTYLLSPPRTIKILRPKPATSIWLWLLNTICEGFNAP